MANHSSTPWWYSDAGVLVVFDREGAPICWDRTFDLVHTFAERRANYAAICVAAESLQRLADLAEACRRLSPSYCADRGCAQIDDDSFDAILEEAVALLEHVTEEGLVLDPFPDVSGGVPTDGGEHC